MLGLCICTYLQIYITPFEGLTQLGSVIVLKCFWEVSGTCWAGFLGYVGDIVVFFGGVGEVFVHGFRQFFGSKQHLN